MLAAVLAVGASVADLRCNAILGRIFSKSMCTPTLYFPPRMKFIRGLGFLLTWAHEPSRDRNEELSRIPLKILL